MKNNKKIVKPRTRRVRVPATKTDFKALSTILVGEQSNRVQDLEKGLLALRESFNNRQALLFKTLVLLYNKDSQLQEKTFQEFIDKVQCEFDALDVSKSVGQDAVFDMIAGGIKHEVRNEPVL